MKSKSRQSTFKIAIQIIGWGILFALPFFLSPNGRSSIPLSRYLEYCIAPVSFMIVFYINYLVLINKFIIQKRQILLMLLTNVVLILSVSLGVHWLHGIFTPHDTPPMEPREFIARMRVFFVVRDAVGLSLTAGLALAIRMTENWYSTEYERKVLEKAKSDAELNNLKSQLNPHFLFNTLNNIYSLIAINSEKAQDAIHDLSHLLRYVLYENNQPMVPLDKEVNFVRSYIELMSMRLGSNFHSQIELPDNSKALIAPMLLITLIENAFKHGMSSSKECFLRVNLVIDEQQQLHFVVINSNYASQTNTAASGIGLENMKKRLQLIYPNRHKLLLQDMGQTFEARLTIKLNSNEL